MNIYDYGQWYRIHFFGINDEGEYIYNFIYTQDVTLGNNKKLRKTMASAGYACYYLDTRTDGLWIRKFDRVVFNKQLPRHA